MRGLKTEIEALRAERNAISAKFPTAAADEKAELGRKAKEAGAKAGELEGRLTEQESALRGLMLQLPGIPWEGAPVGPDESANTVVRTEGTPPEFAFEPLDHVALVEKNDWADLSRDRPGFRIADVLPQGSSRAARGQADGLGARADRRRRLHADHRARRWPARPRSPPRGSSPAMSKRRTSCPTTICGWPAPPRWR